MIVYDIKTKKFECLFLEETFIAYRLGLEKQWLDAVYNGTPSRIICFARNKLHVNFEIKKSTKKHTYK